ncbi:Serine/threonine-protein kinase 36 [Podochytrium sp. JEL0797]|nr:Serine/threonine-protein kinase 36 [Podochytrium sp. JEL0797]
MSNATSAAQWTNLQQWNTSVAVWVTASNAATGVCLFGSLVNLTVLASIYCNRKRLFDSTNNIAWIVTTMVSASILNGIFQATCSQLSVFDFTNNQNVTSLTPAASDVLSSTGYLLLILLFTLNLLLALERNWLVRFSQKLPLKWIISIGLVGLPFWAALVASFTLAQDCDWSFLPLGVPIQYDALGAPSAAPTSLHGILFICGFSYFALVSIAICAIYEDTYFLIADIYDDEEQKWAEHPRTSATTRRHRMVLLRCVVMSIFQLALYSPSIIMIYLSMWKTHMFENYYASTCMQIAAAIIPALDPLATVFPEITSLRDEILCHRRLIHPNIVRCLDSFVTRVGEEVAVITELCTQGDLMDALRLAGRFDEPRVCDFAVQLVSGLEFLHCKAGIVHRDLKLQNILISSTGTLKICDFGFAQLFEPSGKLTLTSVKGTPIYMSPELIKEEPYTHLVDLWALGIILFELHTGVPPFYTTNIFKLIQMILADTPTFPNTVSPIFQHFTSSTLCRIYHHSRHDDRRNETSSLDNRLWN